MLRCSCCWSFTAWKSSASSKKLGVTWVRSRVNYTLHWSDLAQNGCCRAERPLQLHFYCEAKSEKSDRCSSGLHRYSLRCLSPDEVFHWRLSSFSHPGAPSTQSQTHRSWPDLLPLLPVTSWMCSEYLVLCSFSRLSADCKHRRSPAPSIWEVSWEMGSFQELTMLALEASVALHSRG